MIHKQFAFGSALALAAGALTMALPGLAQADTLTSLEAPFRAALESGSFGMALGLVFVAGLATSLTPCVYPMIVITVSVFGARQTTSRMEAAKLSTAFVLGMATLFTPLGVVAALTGDVFGSQLANPWVVIPLALFFLALAASMFGAFDLDLPSGLKNRLATVGGVGTKGAFLLGLVSALIAAPCTGPVVGFLLTWVGTTQNVAFGAASFFSYALGLGTLFWLVGTFSMSLPKSGRWLEWIKSLFGIVMVVAALYFVRDIIPGLMDIPQRTSTFLAACAGLLVVGVAIGAIHLSYHHTPVSERVRKTIGVALSVAGIAGAVGYMEAMPAGAQIAWSHDYEAAKVRALAEGKPMLVDFGASWCGACGELERHTFSDERVVREGQRFIPVKVDMSPDQDTAAKRELLASYNSRGLPLVVLHNGKGSEAARVTSFVPADEFLSIMKKVQ